jgi:hypothetical protein
MTSTVASPSLLKVTLASFTLSIFVSAVLLFSVQPLFTKMVTPVLGGTPAVWSIALVFFQAVLLAGYGYAHIIKTYFTHKMGVAFHLALMAIVLALFLPIRFDPSWGIPPQDGQALWLLIVFGASVGLPFFANAANGPLLQAWFARSSHPQAHDPYFLYGASNLGSMISLIAYPFVVEPSLTLKEQSVWWMYGFGALALLIGVSVMLLSKAFRAEQSTTLSSLLPSHVPLPSQVTVRDGLIWMLLAFIPSGLLVAVTAHISTDVAAVPLLWVFPLALFLLTFVFAFRNGNERFHKSLLMLRPLALVGLIAAMVFWNGMPWEASIAIHLSFFFIVTMICHRELYNARPQADQLTAFYFYMSLGGVLGGIFSSLIAPVIFNSIVEYTLLILAAMLIDPGLAQRLRETSSTVLIRGVLAFAFTCLLVAGIMHVLPKMSLTSQLGLQLGVIVTLIALAFIVSLKEVRLGVIAGSVAAFLPMLGLSDVVIERTRSFFGVHMVRQTEDGRGHYLSHGTTIHGAEHYRDEKGQVLTSRPVPMSYYYPGGPYQQALDSIRDVKGGKYKRVALIGLGAGAMSCFAREGEVWDFYEIDPVVVGIALNPKYFRSVSECAPHSEIILGDGRLTLQKSDHKYDMIILDAFSSDAVPTHLLTAEAMKSYEAKLNTGGGIIFNISNRHLSLSAVIAASAKTSGMVAYQKMDENIDGTGDFYKTLKTRALIAIVTKDPENLGALSRTNGWNKINVPENFRTWTDDYSNLIDAIKRKRRGE